MSGPLSRVVTAIKAAKVIPDVIPEGFSPSVLFSVVWPSSGTEVVLGEKIARNLTETEPEIKVLPMALPKGDDPTNSAPTDNISYTLVMTDPDAPSRTDPKFGQWRHWVLPGVKLPAAGSNENAQAHALKTRAAATPYYPPAPPPDTGYHRYIFLLFQEPAKGLNIPADAVERNGDPASRKKWNAMEFANKFDLKLVGANFFETKDQ